MRATRGTGRSTSNAAWGGIVVRQNVSDRRPYGPLNPRGTVYVAWLVYEVNRRMDSFLYNDELRHVSERARDGRGTRKCGVQPTKEECDGQS